LVLTEHLHAASASCQPECMWSVSACLLTVLCEWIRPVLQITTLKISQDQPD